MYIIPINAITPLDAIKPVEPLKPLESGKATDETAGTAEGASFLDVFRSVYDNVVETNEQTDRDAIDLMLGNIDDLAAVQANIEKASVAVDLLVTVKNQALSAYNEIIKMQV